MVAYKATFKKYLIFFIFFLHGCANLDLHENKCIMKTYSDDEILLKINNNINNHGNISFDEFDVYIDVLNCGYRVRAISKKIDEIHGVRDLIYDRDFNFISGF